MAVERRKDYYESIYQAVAQMAGEHDPKTLLQSLVENVARTLGAKGCSLMLLTPERNVLIHTVACGLSDWYLRKGPVNISRVISYVLEGRPVVVPDAASDERVLYREQAKKEGIVSMLTVPMKLKDEVAGVLRVYTAVPHDFSDEEIRFVETVGNLAAVAMDNAGVFDMVKEDYERLQSDMLQWSAEMDEEERMGELVSPPREEEIRIPPGG